MAGANLPAAVCKVVHTTCSCCGTFTEYDGTQALSPIQLQALQALFCPTCGQRGHAIVGIVSYESAPPYPLKKLPRAA